MQLLCLARRLLPSTASCERAMSFRWTGPPPHSRNFACSLSKALNLQVLLNETSRGVMADMQVHIAVCF